MPNEFLDHYSGRITELGKAMALFPVHPRFGKMLATASAKEHLEILPYMIALVAALTVRVGVTSFYLILINRNIKFYMEFSDRVLKFILLQFMNR